MSKLMGNYVKRFVLLCLLLASVAACGPTPPPQLVPPTFERPTVVFGTDTPTPPPPTNTPEAGVPPTPTVPVYTGTITHTIQAGETLLVIAQMYGVTVEEIVEINNLDNPNLLSVGQVLLVPVK